MKNEIKCPECGYTLDNNITMKCPRCGKIIQNCGGCSGNCLKCNISKKN